MKQKQKQKKEAEKKSKETPINKGNITELEFDVFCKNVPGHTINKYFNKMDSDNRFFCYTIKNKIIDNNNYNICFEITTNSNEITTKKIVSFIKFVKLFYVLNFYIIFIIFSKKIKMMKKYYLMDLDIFKTKPNLVGAFHGCH